MFKFKQILFLPFITILFLACHVEISAASYLKSTYKVENHTKLDLACELRRTSAGRSLKSVIWTSSNPKNATINKSGIVTAVKMGLCTVTAQSGNITITTTVIVKPNSTLKYNATRIPVLMFHRIVDDKVYSQLKGLTEWTAKVSAFKEQLDFLYTNGYKTISLEEFFQWHAGKRRLPENSVLLTFDDGHSEGYHIVYPLLRKYNFKAVFFIIGSITPEKTGRGPRIGRDKIAEIRRTYPNLEIQSHTWNLHYKDNNKTAMRLSSKEEILADLKKMEREFGFNYLAYPFASYSDDTLQALKSSNIKMAFTSGVGHFATRSDSVYAIHRIPITAKTSFKSFRKWVALY